ncbi:MAG: hypothetical protein K6F25_01140, partial [Bacteroidales bacterium]|nr:hypothetical protein [Bacteroidales bacterium]
KKLGETMSTILQCNLQLNKAPELNARSLEEFLISGFVSYRLWYGWRNDKLDCWIDPVSADNIIMDPHMRDFRGGDESFIGEIHDISLLQVFQRFAKSPQDYARLAEIYSAAKDQTRLRLFFEQFGYSENQASYDFLFPADRSRCRVIEVWRKECKPRLRCRDYNRGLIFKCELEDRKELVDDVNEKRIRMGTQQGIAPGDIPLVTAEWFMDEYWYYYYLSPFGDILDEGETPYEHKGHPYVFKAYPFIDGEIHSFVADVIDQQRYTNRLITMYDWIMRASAKGVLLFPEDAIPEGYDINDIADEWSRFNGVIMIRKRKDGSVMPQQIANNSTNIGISELLNLQLKFFEDISGVHGAIQGQTANSGVSGALYAQQTQNATTSLLDILECFSSFVVDVAYKDVKNMQQYYDMKRVFNIAGRSAGQIVYEPDKIRDVEFDLSIVESRSTPVYRQMANEWLMQIWSAGQISLQQLLEHGDFPFGDELLQSIQSQQEQIEKGEVPQGLSPQLLEQLRQGANMDDVDRAHQMLTGQYRMTA